MSSIKKTIGKTSATKCNAIDFIKNSNIFENERYSWITPLISKVLDDSLAGNDVQSLVSSLFPKKEDIEPQPEGSGGVSVWENESEEESEESLNIKKITSIEEVKNIGLLDIDTPFELKDGLNIFYGRNGAGKSSIYRSLCKVLGKEQNVYSNVSSEDESSSCNIKVEDAEGNSTKLEWNTDDDNDEIRAMIFDSSISNFIVEQDQINEFKMAHLKMEYFSFLHNLYEKIEDEVRKEIDSIQDSSSKIESVLYENVPSIFSDEITKELASEFSFTKEEAEKLAGYEHQLKTLATNSFEATKRNLDNVIDDIDNVIQTFGIEEKDEDGNNNITLYYTKDYLEEVNKKILTYNALKAAFQDSGKNKIAKLLPEDWINNRLWEDFISSSVDFVNSLDNEETTEKYTEESCAYCHQPLHTEEAKMLVRAYQELHNEHREKLDNALDELLKISDLFQECIDDLDTLVEKNKKIEAEFSTIDQKDKIKSKIGTVKNVFLGYKKSLDEQKEIEVDDADIGAIQTLWEEYVLLADKFDSKSTMIEKITSNKEAQILDYERKAAPLRKKKVLFENKKSIIAHLDLKETLLSLGERLGDLTAIKQATSTLKTSFSREAPLREFKEYLEKEYENLSFTPNETWNIKHNTRGDINRRVYNIGDRRLAEIFSEGERKLHALADFFAQCELNQYDGVYIFDDPVNSLDEGNIEIVAERILKLVDEGTQVIIFTHNLVFLNSLIDTEKEKVNNVLGTSNQVILESETLIGDKQKLKKRLEKIDSRMSQFSNRDEDSISEYDLKNVYDLMSGYLEDYVELVYFRNIINRFRPNIRMHSLENLKTLDLNIVDPLMKLYKKTSRNGSRHSQPDGIKKPQYKELVEDVSSLKTQFPY